MNRLVDFVRSVYDDEGYDEVITPQIFSAALFEKSGHLANYNENMYFAATHETHDEIAAGGEWFDPAAALPGDQFKKSSKEYQDAVHHWVDELKGFSQKPMNCPGHCLIFGHRRRSYRELPMRLADFGRLHRYERGGVVHGLARVRSFSQDDAHIFCTPAQVEAETGKFLKTFYAIYELFGFKKIDIKLATRPEKRLGNDEMWDVAEGSLERGLKAAGLAFEVTPGEGAFYGPKLEFHVQDALKRSWQLGTFQLDYALPERFELGYVGDDGASHRPVMLHRAWYGSLERFLAVYIEQVAGGFPAWLSPEQVALVTVSEKQTEYALEVSKLMRARGLRVVEDFGADKLGAKIRNARLMRYPYIGVLGAQEAEERAVTPRSRELGDLEKMPLDAFIEKLVAESQLPKVAFAR
jgi:threonyl-tRNA synthetase